MVAKAVGESTDLQAANAEKELPDCGHSSVRARATSRLPMSVGSWPPAAGLASTGGP